MKRPPSSTSEPGTASQDDIAMRESAAFLQTRHPRAVAAMQWHTRREQGLTTAEEVEFQQWLDADPAHQAALAGLDRDLSMLRQLPAERTAHLRAAHPAPANAPRRRGWRWLAATPTIRHATVAFCCVALLAIGVGWHQWRAQPIFEQAYSAQRGQRLDITLPDGSQFTLDTDTRVEVALYRDRRQVRLANGQAMFSVARDVSRPFTVLAGPARVTVLGTRFAVRCEGCEVGIGEVDVEVEEGHVGVTHTGPNGDSGNDAVQQARAELRAGQTVKVSANGLGALAAVSPSSIAPWRKGLIRFASTPLAEAVREFERYGPLNLVIRDPEVAAMPIGGSYLASNPAAFAQALPHILPVQLLRRDDGLTEVVRNN
jgi:transmembrane sensor